MLCLASPPSMWCLCPAKSWYWAGGAATEKERKGLRQKKQQRARGFWKRWEFETWEGWRMKRIRGKRANYNCSSCCICILNFKDGSIYSMLNKTICGVNNKRRIQIQWSVSELSICFSSLKKNKRFVPVCQSFFAKKKCYGTLVKSPLTKKVGEESLVFIYSRTYSACSYSWKNVSEF